MADQRYLYTENACGAGHPTVTDNINRLALVEHNNDGTHKKTINITNETTPARTFSIATRDAVGAWPVPYFRPNTTNTTIAFDIMPNGTPAENGTNGYAWFDVIDADASATNPAMTAARVANRSTHIEFGSRSYNGASLKKLALAIEGDPVLAIQTTKDISFGDSTGINGQRYFTFTNYSNGASAYTDMQVRSDSYATKYLAMRHYSSAYSYDSSNYADKSQITAVGSDLLIESSSDVWILPGGGAYSANNNGMQVTTLATLPKVDNNQTIGSAAKRWSGAYAATIYPGAGTVKWTSGSGTPEGAVTAAVGSMYTRTDGGAGTTLYVKESGAGNTGWVSK